MPLPSLPALRVAPPVECLFVMCGWRVESIDVSILHMERWSHTPHDGVSSLAYSRDKHTSAVDSLDGTVEITHSRAHSAWACAPHRQASGRGQKARASWDDGHVCCNMTVAKMRWQARPALTGLFRALPSHSSTVYPQHHQPPAGAVGANRPGVVLTARVLGAAARSIESTPFGRFRQPSSLTHPHQCTSQPGRPRRRHACRRTAPRWGLTELAT